MQTDITISVSPKAATEKESIKLCSARKLNIDVNSISDIKIESFREEGEVGIHKTVFKSPDDEIILYHNAYNRKIFAQGALDTSQWISNQSSGLYTYEN